MTSPPTGSAHILTAPYQAFHARDGYLNIGGANHARFNLPEYNKLYEAQQVLPDGPERLALMQRAQLLLQLLDLLLLAEHGAVQFLQQVFGIAELDLDLGEARLDGIRVGHVTSPARGL
mgnify:CR=1 FL=1